MTLSNNETLKLYDKWYNIFVFFQSAVVEKVSVTLTTMDGSAKANLNYVPFSEMFVCIIAFVFVSHK